MAAAGAGCGCRPVYDVSCASSHTLDSTHGSIVFHRLRPAPCKAWGQTKLDKGRPVPAAIQCLYLNGGGWKTSETKRRVLQHIVAGNLHHRRTHIAAFAEVHADTDELKERWAAQMQPDGRSYFTSHLAVLVGPELQGVAVQATQYAEGRVIRLDLDLPIPTTHVYMYAPGSDTDRRRQQFFSDISAIFPAGRELVVAADFNCVDDKTKDKVGGDLRGMTAGTRQWGAIRRGLHLHDVWRQRHPDDATTMSWVRRGQSTATRIDRVEMTAGMAASTVDIGYHTVAYSERGRPDVLLDHKMLRWRHELPQIKPRPKRRRMVASIMRIGGFIATAKQLIADAQSHGSDDLNDDIDELGETIWQAYAKHHADLSRTRHRQLRRLQQQVDKKEAMALLRELQHSRSSVSRLAEATESAADAAAAEQDLAEADWGERPTAAFFKQVRQAGAGGNIARLHRVQDGVTDATITDTDASAIADSFASFYEDLFQHRPQDKPFVDKLCALLPRATAAKRKQLAADITVDEVRAAIKAAGKGKSPGSTGIISEFYQDVEAEISPVLAAQFNYARRVGMLSDAQRTAVMSLLYKHKGSPLDPDSYRPLSLCQRDRCIFAMVLVRRVRGIIRDIIDTHQSAFTSRDIQTHVLGLHDAAEHARRTRQITAVASTDWAKCFDRIQFGITDAIHDMAFGVDPEAGPTGTAAAGAQRPRTFTDWTRLLTAGGLRVVIVNGHRSRVFRVGGGSPQGCPYSPYVLCLLQATLAALLKRQLAGRGLQLPDGTELIVMAFADDQQLIVTGATPEVASANLAQAVDIVDDWSRRIGMALNRSKSEGMWLVSKTLPPPAFATGDEAALVWKTAAEGIKCVGTRIGPGNDQGWTQLLAKVLQRLQRWTHIRLGYRGRVMVLLTMATSLLWYTAAVWPVPPDISGKLCAAIRCFFWTGRIPLDATTVTSAATYTCRNPLKWTDIARPEAEGGFNLWHPVEHMTALAAKWVARYLEPGYAPWKVLPRYWLQQATSLTSAAVDAVLVHADKDIRLSPLGRAKPAANNEYPPPPARWRYYLRSWGQVTHATATAEPSQCETMVGHSLWHNRWLQGMTSAGHRIVRRPSTTGCAPEYIAWNKSSTPQSRGEVGFPSWTSERNNTSTPAHCPLSAVATPTTGLGCRHVARPCSAWPCWTPRHWQRYGAASSTLDGRSGCGRDQVRSAPASGLPLSRRKRTLYTHNRTTWCTTPSKCCRLGLEQRR